VSTTPAVPAPTTGIVDTGGKFTAGVKVTVGHIFLELYINRDETGGKFAARGLRKFSRKIEMVLLAKIS
jgi:hypothetical protein